LFVFRHRNRGEKVAFEVPGHPFTTAFFVLACWTVVVATILNNPVNSLIGYAILAAGIPACLYWQRKNRRAAA
jgi:APA family basic amino acid/polyamine antiporter